ncbi:DMT family transporter [Metabacillus litoralis]|jgi:drug/metabolite transporter (DMT)-like permease|uniref:DMT family transporter n=1 Tax=Metabacillus litoralis TaxID=152268 RepID=UPI00203CBF91|nr:DMT family transporter [Metabacillus litoralis]MCM3655169.1 DMT family transporter [Metabacillus litoralis]
MKELSRTKTISLITILVVLWGASWPIYKIALGYTPPLLFAGMRTLFGGLLLVILLAPKWKQIRWKENWPIYLIASMFNVILFYGVQTVGLTYIPSGLFSVIVYLQPVLVGLFAWLWLGEQMTIVKVTGLIIGFLGVSIVSAGGFSGHIAITGVILALISGLSWALGTVYIKKVSYRVNLMWLTAFQCLIGGIVLTGIGSGVESWSNIIWNPPYLFGLIFGSILGIAVSWIIYFTLVNSGDASKVATYTFLVPLLSVFAGTLFLSEPFTINLVIGLLFITFSIHLVNRKPNTMIEHSKKAA